MKKFCMILMAAILSLALVMPAMAKVTVGGIIFVDAFYNNYDQNFMRNNLQPPFRVGALDDEWSKFDLFNTYGTRLKVTAVNDRNDVGAYIEVRVLDEHNTSHNKTGLPETVESDQLYGWWQINPMFKLTVGQQQELISWGNTYNYFGSDRTAYAASKGFGNIGGNKIPAIRLDAKVTDAVTISGMMGYVTGGAAASWGTLEEESTTPRFDLMVDAKIGPVEIMPSYAWHKISFDRDQASAVPVGSDDDITSWAFSIPASASFGPLKLEAEYNTGQNLQNSNIDHAYAPNPGNGRYNLLKGVQGGSGAATWVMVGGVWKVYDTDYDGWWAAATYSFSRALSVKLVYGEETVEQDEAPLANQFKYDRDGWTASLTWVPAKIFTITPFYGIYDHGTARGLGTGTRQNLDLGEVTQYGVEFAIVF